MKDFLRFPVALTVLSPLHIGCGEYFDPTQYIIKDGVLYGFDPSRIPLKRPLLQELNQVASRGSMKDLARFYEKQSESCMCFAQSMVPVAASLSQKYRSIYIAPAARSNQGYAAKAKPKEENQCLIDKTTFYFNKEGLTQPYIPGSGIKGAIHTALLDRINNGQARDSGQSLDKDIFEGTFDKSPMKAIKVRDFMSPRSFVGTEVLLSKRVKKNLPLSGQGIPSYFESILPGECRLFAGEIILEVGSSYLNPHAYQELSGLFKDLNRYYLDRFNEEASYSYSPKWVTRMKQLIRALSEPLNSGKVALIRIGKNNGAENMVLQGGIAKIRRGKFGVSSRTSTVWKCDCHGEDLPFGWALLEADLSSQPLPQSMLPLATDSQEFSNRLYEQRKERYSRYAEQEAIENKRLEEEQAQKAAKEQEEKKRKQELQSLSENLQKVYVLAGQLNATNRAVKPGTELYIQTLNLVRSALDWPIEEQKQCAQMLAALIKKRDMYQGKDAKALKNWIKTLKHE